jgi:class I fructose-bisphosphate aldolase
MVRAPTTQIELIANLLGSEADSLLTHHGRTIDKSLLHLLSPDFLDRVFLPSDRNTGTCRPSSITAGWPGRAT